MIEEALTESYDPDNTRDPEMILTLCVRDPIALAKRESKSARMLADRLPVMVNKALHILADTLFTGKKEKRLSDRKDPKDK